MGRRRRLLAEGHLQLHSSTGASFTSDRLSYARRGLKRSLAEQRLAAIADEVDVYYNPAAPEEAYLITHDPKLGIVVLAGGGVGAAIGLLLLLPELACSYPSWRARSRSSP